MYRANGWLTSSKTESAKVFKPDWVVYVKPWYQRCEIAVCEVKPPSKLSSGPLSDFAKLGLEMQQMLVYLKQKGIRDAYVLGILVEGKADGGC